MRRMTCPVCQRKGIRYKKWRLALVLAVHAVKENGTLVCGQGSGMVIKPLHGELQSRKVRL